MSIDKIQSVRIRKNGRGSRISFVEFRRLDYAIGFHRRFHPTVSFPLENSRGVDSDPITATVEYSIPREEFDPSRQDQEDSRWVCPECGGINFPHRALCYRCKTERPNDTLMEGGLDFDADLDGPVLTGETDQCPRQTPSQFVVIRDLEPSVTEGILANGVMKLFVDNTSPPTHDASMPTPKKLKSTAPAIGTAGLGATPGSLRRVFLIRGRKYDESWRYGFAEFATVEDAKGAVAKFMASATFTIASKPVMVAFIHSGVFVPIIETLSEEMIRKFTFTPVYNPDLRVRYWDDRAYPSAHVVFTGPDMTTTPQTATARDGASAQDTCGKKSKKDKESLTGKKALAMTPQMQMWAKKAAELHSSPSQAQDEQVDEPKPASPRQMPEKTRAASETGKSNEPGRVTYQDKYVSYADWSSLECLLCGCFASEEGLIYHEVREHDHYENEEVKAKAAALLASRGKEPRTITRRVRLSKIEYLREYASYADQDKLICYLCRRQFRTVPELRRHERESELHKGKLAEPGTVDKATAELAKAGWRPTWMLPSGYHGPVGSVRGQGQAGTQYRDRAKERREVYNQPNRPALLAGKRVTEKVNPAEKPTTGEAEGLAKTSKGAGLLAKMGWTEGEGLGAQGEGRTQAVSTEAYAPGVGLGAEGGKLGDAVEEAERKTRKKPSDFVEKTKDKARERFERLQ